MKNINSRRSNIDKSFFMFHTNRSRILFDTNLLSIITENGSSLKDLMNTTTDFTKNIYFKLNTKPTDVLTHQFTVKFTKENGDVILAKSKKLTWLN